jgi:hypothetical protein
MIHMVQRSVQGEGRSISVGDDIIADDVIGQNSIIEKFNVANTIGEMIPDVGIQAQPMTMTRSPDLLYPMMSNETEYRSFDLFTNSRSEQIDVHFADQDSILRQDYGTN